MAMALRSQVTDDDPLTLTKWELRAHPGLRDAVLLSAAGTIAFHESDAVLHANQKDGGRFLFTLLFIHAYYADGHVGLTRISALCETIGLCGAGRAAAMLTQMERGGYLLRDPSDRRRLTPSPTGLAAVRERIRSEMNAAALISPDVQPVLARLDDERVFGAVMRALGASFILRREFFVAKDSAAQLFTQRDCGMLVLFSICLAGRSDDSIPPTGPVKVSIADMADKFTVSRAHVRKLISDAEEAGLIQRGDSLRELTLSPALRDAVLDFFVTVFGVMTICARAASAEASPA